MLAQDYVLRETYFSVAVKAALRGKRISEWNSVQISVLQIGNGLGGNSRTVRADLLIVAHHDHFPGDIEQKQTVDAELARLINDDEIETSRRRIDHFRHEVTRHDPRRDGIAALVHVLPRFLPQPFHAGRPAGAAFHRAHGLPPCS